MDKEIAQEADCAGDQAFSSASSPAAASSSGKNDEEIGIERQQLPSPLDASVNSNRLRQRNAANPKSASGDVAKLSTSVNISVSPRPPRLLPRNLPLQQSRNRPTVANILKSSATKRGIGQLLMRNWFHTLLRSPTFTSLTLLLVLWTAAITLFAGFYVWHDSSLARSEVGSPVCSLARPGQRLSYQAAFAFSLQTCTTVGYTLPSGSNAFFEPCPALQVVIYWQMVWSMLFNAFLFAFAYARLAKNDSRGVQVMFSETAIVSLHEVISPFPGSNSDGSSNLNPSSQNMYGRQNQMRFQVRIYDVDCQAPVVEAHVRVYAVMKQNPVPTPLRLLQPNDQLGGMLLLSVPSVVSHTIDLYSLLHPHMPQIKQTPRSYGSKHLSNQLHPQPTSMSPPLLTPLHGLNLRQADSRTGSREEVLCPVCGESYGTVERLMCHIRYNQIMERHDKWSTRLSSKNAHLSASHLSLQLIEEYCSNNTLSQSTDEARRHYNNESNDINYNTIFIKPSSTSPTLDVQQVKEHFNQHVSEIVVVVEGIEPTVSGTFAAMQSYRLEDIVFHPSAYYTPCIINPNISIQGNSDENSKNIAKKLQVDLNAFHRVSYIENDRQNISSQITQRFADAFATCHSTATSTSADPILSQKATSTKIG